MQSYYIAHNDRYGNTRLKGMTRPCQEGATPEEALRNYVLDARVGRGHRYVPQDGDIIYVLGNGTGRQVTRFVTSVSDIAFALEP